MVIIRAARGKLTADILKLKSVSAEKIVAKVVGDKHRAAAKVRTAVVTSARPS